MEIHTIQLQREDGRQIRLRARVADSPAERSAGFQHICPEIIALSSILFVYRTPTVTSFHMNNVHDELDIGFFDESGALISVLQMKPRQADSDSAAIYGIGSREFMYALETRAGFFSEHGLSPNETILIYP